MSLNDTALAMMHRDLLLKKLEDISIKIDTNFESKFIFFVVRKESKHVELENIQVFFAVFVGLYLSDLLFIRS